MYALKEKLKRRTNRYKPDRRKLKKVADFGYIETDKNNISVQKINMIKNGETKRNLGRKDFLVLRNQYSPVKTRNSISFN